MDPILSNDVANDALSIAMNSLNELAESKELTSNQEDMKVTDALDPVILCQNMFARFSLFEDLLERVKLKDPNPVNVMVTLLNLIDELLAQVNEMLKECCHFQSPKQSSQENQFQLSESICNYLSFPYSTVLSLKPEENIPVRYRRILFSANEIEESNLFDDEYISLPDHKSKPSTHKKKRSRQRFSQCDKCLKSWNDIRSFELHQKEPGKCPGKPWFKLLPGKKYLCIHPFCNGTALEFADQSNYWNHVREKHWIEEDLVIECPHCREKFPLIEMMKHHIKLSHPKTKMCRFCGSVFATKNDLAKHERTHTGEKPFACDKCTFRTSTAGTLRGHIKRRHEDPNLHRTFVCNQCEKGFFSAFDLRQHILTHSDVKRYTCPACGKQLKNDSCYRRHMMCVHGQKFSCEICSKDFSALMGLNIHKRDVHGIVS